MKRTLVRDIYASPDSFKGQITIGGWLRTLRSSGTVAFAEINDGSYFKNIQVVIGKDEVSNSPRLQNTTWAQRL